MNMKDSKKLTYITPQADIIDIEFPDVLCAGSCTDCETDGCLEDETCSTYTENCELLCTQVAYS